MTKTELYDYLNDEAYCARYKTGYVVQITHTARNGFAIRKEFVYDDNGDYLSYLKANEIVSDITKAAPWLMPYVVPVRIEDLLPKNEEP